MTRDAFIQKWLDSKKPYNDENRMAMLDDLDKVILRGMATDNTRLAELEAQYHWWVEYDTDMFLDHGEHSWSAYVWKIMAGFVLDKDGYATKAEAEAACIQYLLTLNNN